VDLGVRGDAAERAFDLEEDVAIVELPERAGRGGSELGALGQEAVERRAQVLELADADRFVGLGERILERTLVGARAPLGAGRGGRRGAASFDLDGHDGPERAGDLVGRGLGAHARGGLT
jgi:hypothetical protein